MSIAVLTPPCQDTGVGCPVLLVLDVPNPVHQVPEGRWAPQKEHLLHKADAFVRLRGHFALLTRQPIAEMPQRTGNIADSEDLHLPQAHAEDIPHQLGERHAVCDGHLPQKDDLFARNEVFKAVCALTLVAQWNAPKLIPAPRAD